MLTGVKNRYCDVNRRNVKAIGGLREGLRKGERISRFKSVRIDCRSKSRGWVVERCRHEKEIREPVSASSTDTRTIDLGEIWERRRLNRAVLGQT